MGEREGGGEEGREGGEVVREGEGGREGEIICLHCSPPLSSVLRGRHCSADHRLYS